MSRSIFFGCLLMIVVDIIYAIATNYSYTSEIESEWVLADRASTIEMKADHVNRFVIALEDADLTGSHDALFLKKPSNSFDDNLIAIKSLQERLDQIQQMDPLSFQYNTAIQQITEQEQGLATEMLGVFSGCYWKEHAILLWDWVAVLQITVTCIVALLAGVAAWGSGY